MEITKDQLQELYNECKKVGIITKNNQLQSICYKVHFSELLRLYQDQLQYLLINLCNNNYKLLRYCLINNTLNVHPKCPICKEKDRKFNGNSFFETCGSEKCKLKQIEQSNLKKYGCKYILQSKELREKSKQTMIKKYGVDNPAKSKEIYNKIKQTNLEKYNTTCPLYSEIGKEKKRQTMLDRYGVDHPLKSKEIQDRIKQTCLDHFGVDYPAKSKEIQEKIKQTNIEKYGVEHYSMTDEYKEKIKNTCLEKYNVTNPMQNIDIYKKSISFKSYYYNNIYFDSSYELVFYKFCIDHNIFIKREPTKFEYQDKENNIHYYYPDFQVSYQNKTRLIEISSDYTWSTKSNEKKKIIEDNNVLVLLDKDIQKYFNYCKKINFNIREYKL